MFRRTPARRPHHKAHDLLSVYLDGQLTPQERDRVEEHLRACVACTNELESLRYTKSLLQAAPSLSLPRAFTLSEAMVGVAAARRRPPYIVSYLQGATALVAALLLVVIAGDFLHLGMPRTIQLPAEVQKAVVVTVAVEVQATPELAAAAMVAEAPAAEAAPAEPEAPPELLVEALLTEAPVEEVTAATEPAPRAAAKVTEPETMALSATPLIAPLGMGGGGAPQQADEATASAARETNQLLAEATAAPEAVLKQALAPAAATAALEAMPMEAPGPTEAPLAAEVAAQEWATPTETLPATAALAEAVAVASDQVDATTAPRPLPTPLPTFTGAGWPAATSWWTIRRIVEVLLAVVLAILVALTLWLRRRR